MWYPSIESLRNGPEYGTHMWAYLNTEDNGELDLTPLKDMWGVDNCFVRLYITRALYAEEFALTLCLVGSRWT